MVTTPQCFHKDPVIYAMEKGKKVYCDKPLAHTLEDAAQAVGHAFEDLGEKLNPFNW